jgi:hypothetical protein
MTAEPKQLPSRWQRAVCVLWNGSHELYKAHDDTRLYQQCVHCGHETRGWTIDRRDRRATMRTAKIGERHVQVQQLELYPGERAQVSVVDGNEIATVEPEPGLVPLLLRLRYRLVGHWLNRMAVSHE